MKSVQPQILERLTDIFVYTDKLAVVHITTPDIILDGVSGRLICTPGWKPFPNQSKRNPFSKDHSNRERK